MEGHGFLAAEEAGVVLAGAGGECFDAGAGGEGGGGFVETDMAVGADAEELEVDASCGADSFFVASAEFFGIGRHAIGDVDVRAIDVHMPEEVLVHERVVGLRVVGANADVFIEVEGGDVGPVEVLLDELAVEWHGGSTGGEAEDGVGFCADGVGEEAGGHSGSRFGIGLDDNFHRIKNKDPVRRRHCPRSGGSPGG